MQKIPLSPSNGSPRLKPIPRVINQTHKLGFGFWLFSGCWMLVFGACFNASSATFTPIAVPGYTQDMVVEASAAPGALVGFTTATMSPGTANTSNTWYEVE